jgi:hypothetical protein
LHHDLSPTLKALDIDIESISKLVHVGDDEALAFCGSIPEGLANHSADIDLLILGAPEKRKGLTLDDGTLAQSVWHDEKSREINTESWTSAELRSLGDRLEKCARGVLRPQGENDLKFIRAFGELRLLHRVNHAVVLKNPDRFAYWRGVLKADLFPSYLTAMRLFEHYNFREDFIGEMEAGRHQSAAWIMRICLLELAGSMLANVGETNALLQKWLVPLFYQFRDQIGRERIDEWFRWANRPVDDSLSMDEAKRFIEFCDEAAADIFRGDRTIYRSVTTLVDLVRLRRSF